MATSGGDAQLNNPSEPQPNSTAGNHHGEADLAEADLDEVDLDAVDLDEVDLDTEEIDLAEADLDMDSTEEFAVADSLQPEFPSYSRRETPAPRKTGPMIVIIAAHAVVILAALCIFYQKSKQHAGASYDPDYDVAASQDYVTPPNTCSRYIENAVRSLGLPCRIIEAEKESPAAPEARVVLQKTTYKSKQELRQVINAAAVRVANEIFRRDDRVRSVYVEIRAPLSSRKKTDPAITVTFDRSKINGTMRDMSPKEILHFFGARYAPGLLQN
ncbi:MAG: hypothetical protein GXP25_15350 [Planctomycetes bacterium]|nr:hypothetical protein [Planctomycetota bacterium]